MRKWLYILYSVCFLFFLINSMPKCLGCKKEFKSQGFPAHKRSCNFYKREIKARLTKVVDSNLVAGPSNKTTILDDVDNLGITEDMDDVQAVCNGEFNGQKKTDSTINIGTRERTHASSRIPKIWSSTSQNKTPEAVPGYPAATASCSGCCCSDYRGTSPLTKRVR
jgi:hypothetical protein